MAFPLPGSWKKSALEILRVYYDGDIAALVDEGEGEEEEDDADDFMSDDDEKSVPPVAGFLQTFRAQDFREGFFKAIGHRYFMAIQRILTEEKP